MCIGLDPIRYFIVFTLRSMGGGGGIGPFVPPALSAIKCIELSKGGGVMNVTLSDGFYFKF